MENLSVHFAPLLFMPGVGLLLVSTSNRLVNVNNRILKLKTSEDPFSSEQLLLYEKRVVFFRKALISLYICLGLIAIATLVNCFDFGNGQLIVSVARFLMTLAVMVLCHAIFLLIYESWVALKMLNK